MKDIKNIAKILVPAMTIGLGTWMLVEPLKDFFGQMEISPLIAGLVLIILGVWVAKRYSLN